MKALRCRRWVLCVVAIGLLGSGWAWAEESVSQAMDSVVNRLYATKSLDELYAITNKQIENFITPEERHAFATQHWCFDVNVPVVVSVMHDVDQKTPPFWLREDGFKKTGMIVKNMENWKYAVWQKKFPAGRVELGINGFDKFRAHYFVCVGPQTPGTKVTLSNFYPAGQEIEVMKPGSLIYHDWTELVLTQVPKALLGQQLLPTSRGRSVDAALIGSFRKTLFPSSDKPDLLYLTWSGDPHTTQTIQWRTDSKVKDGVARYRKKGAKNYSVVKGTFSSMDDRMLANDRVCNWHVAVVRGLTPGTTYEYQVGSPTANTWSAWTEFKTEPENPKQFSFFWASDVHSNVHWGHLQTAVFKKHPEAAFCVLSGDLVRTGAERGDWDEMLKYGEPMYRTRPIMPAVGNHDAQYGLGAGMYLQIFNLPKNGPKALKPNSAYTFSYGNTEFFVLDVMADTKAQTVWLKKQLAKSTATWKIVMFHFPIYWFEDESPDLGVAWGPLIDKYHVDLVLMGHIHEYTRTYPMYGGKRVASTAKGTVYYTTISIPHHSPNHPQPAYIEKWIKNIPFAVEITIKGKHLGLTAYEKDGSVGDTYAMDK